MNIYLDIETIPSQTPAIRQEIADTITAPGQYKKPESIEKWLTDNRESATDEIWRKTALDGTYGEIICIAWAIDDEPVDCTGRGLGGSEGEVLDTFLTFLASKIKDSRTMPVWIGHYLSGFDLRFIWQRCVINGVKPPFHIPYDAKPWSDVIFDTKLEWTGPKSTGFGSLDKICRAFGYDGKGDIDGSKVWDYVKDGRIDEVMEYCKDDVEKTRLLHKRMTFSG